MSSSGHWPGSASHGSQPVHGQRIPSLLCLSSCKYYRPPRSLFPLSEDLGPSWTCGSLEQAPREVRGDQEGAQGGAALLHHLDPEPDLLAFLLHDLVYTIDKPPVRRGWVEGN